MGHRDDLSLDHLSRKQLDALLELAADAPRSHGSLPALATRSPEMLARLAALKLEDGRSGESVLGDLLRAGTPLNLIRRAKDAIKRGVESAAGEESRDSWTLLYHVAIAAAYASHGVNISSRPIESRLGLYEDFATAIPHHEIGRMFRATLERAHAEGL